MRDALHELEQLRRLRQRPERDLSIGETVRATADTLRRTERGLGDLVELWRALLPADLAERTTIVGLRSGTLEVEADSAPVRYELDRVLRSGVLTELKRRHRGTLVRVRIRTSGRKRPT